MVSMYIISQYISNICWGFNKEVECVQKKLICSHFLFISLDIPATIGLVLLGYQFRYALVTI